MPNSEIYKRAIKAVLADGVLDNNVEESFEVLDELFYLFHEARRDEWEEQCDGAEFGPTEEAQPMPCPRCGSQEVTVGHRFFSGADTVCCEKCGYHMEGVNRNDAVETWNELTKEATSRAQRRKEATEQ